MQVMEGTDEGEAPGDSAYLIQSRNEIPTVVAIYACSWRTIVDKHEDPPARDHLPMVEMPSTQG
ncbi:hypothetical protein N7474_007716 [Penicillium riverlandense]|uniref:uncharacterized protein n=1 Tax=Penicillium riverlandense TaxID=1903569 RepID=UPI002546D8C3|nr:uncharacterized protein N7474_007716 [Penicillium riverlandense]KAJ5811415.1 hypothetical protein N7474_007716 [Penicillium riverlandense]